MSENSKDERDNFSRAIRLLSKEGAPTMDHQAGFIRGAETFRNLFYTPLREKSEGKVTVLDEQAKHPLDKVLTHLLPGRSEEEQSKINEWIKSLQSDGKEEK